MISHDCQGQMTSSVNHKVVYNVHHHDYYLERNILSGPGRDHRYWLCYLSTPMWDQSQYLPPEASEGDTSQPVSESWKKERQLQCFSKWTDLVMSFIVHTFIQNISTEYLWNIVWGKSHMGLVAKSLGYWESIFTLEVSKCGWVLKSHRSGQSPDYDLGRRHFPFNAWRLEGRTGEGKEERKGRKEEMAILESLKEILQVLMCSHRVRAWLAVRATENLNISKPGPLRMVRAWQACGHGIPQ